MASHVKARVISKIKQVLSLMILFELVTAKAAKGGKKKSNILVF